MDSPTTQAATLADLQRIADAFAQQLRPGMRVGLVGPLGAGKTAFTKALARSFGIHDEVISPTYVYHQVYDIPAAVQGLHHLHHLDLYRLSSDTQLSSLDLLPDDPHGLSVIEWIDHVPGLVATADVLVRLSADRQGVRTVRFDWRQS